MDDSIHFDLGLAASWFTGRELNSANVYENIIVLVFDADHVIQAEYKVEIQEQLVWNTGELCDGFELFNQVIGEVVSQVELVPSLSLTVVFANDVRLRVLGSNAGYEWVHLIRPGEQAIGC